ncbi:MAG TPA: FISUMP domain-containing protein [Tenuifilaceae bacterium]|nr:FISUMP domain-containing protein [Tenuifilaceae bacterium]
MAVTSLAITQDNIYNGVDLLATDSPLKFICQLTDTAVTPPYSFPDHVEVEVTDLSTAVVYTGYRSYQFYKKGNICKYIFQADKIIRMIMGSFDDPETDSIQSVNNLVRQFRVKFIHSALNDSVDFFAYRAARQVGQREAMTEIATNGNEIAFGFKDRELYLHYYVGGISDDIIFDGLPYNGGGMIRLRKTPDEIGTENILVYRYSTPIFVPIYGYLYNKLAVIDSGKFIPTAMVTEGWRVPSSTDITNLLTYAGNEVLKLKSCRMVYNAVTECNTKTHPRWDEDWGFEGTNETTFGALPNGKIDGNEVFSGLGTEFNIMLSDVVVNKVKAFTINEATATMPEYDSVYGLGVRLVRNATTAELLLPDGLISETYYYGNGGRNYLCYKVGSQVWTPFLAETKLNDNTDIYLAVVSHDQDTIWCYNTDIPERAAYDYNNLYIGAEDDDYYLAKTITLNVLPNCETGLYVKFLDSTTGYYKFWLFDRYFEQNFKHSSIGVVENFTENLLNSGQRMVGRKATPSISVVESGMEQVHIDYISGLFTSPRIYIWRDSTWIPVSIEDGTTITKYRKGNAKDFAITFIEEELNTVTML